MLRLITLLTLLQICVTQNKTESNSFDEIFNDHKNVNSTDSLKCDRVIGSSPICMDCYNCEHEHLRSRPSLRLTLKNNKCQESKVCCIYATDYIVRHYDNCGSSNPQGLPRRRRPSMNAVLEREFPWRARVYSASRSSDEPLCDATYIGYKIRALVTTASCVNNRLPGELVVKFTNRQRTPNQIADVIIHPQFEKATRKNDIALLLLKHRPDYMVSFACVSQVPPQFGTPCYTVSSKETTINVVVPQDKLCHTAIKSNGTGLMCTQSAPAQEDAPEGAGVFCTEQLAGKTIHVLHGVSLNMRKNNFLSVHINITNFGPWMDSVVQSRTELFKGVQNVAQPAW